MGRYQQQSKRKLLGEDLKEITWPNRNAHSALMQLPFFF
jgi:hypothetical protein